MDSSIRLGKIFGIPLGINYSWLIVFGLVIFLMSSRFEEVYPYWPVASRWSVAILTTALFFLSVLAHELSHSLVALAWGIPVRGITLFIFGGVSQLAHDAQRPMTEFLVSAVGPATSLALAIILGIAWYLLGDYSSYLSAVLFTLFAINLSLAVFNMLPGYPLDGGRVLRAGIWGATGNYWLATRLAIHAGQGMGILMVSGGVVWALTGNFQAIWLALVGGFLVYVATANYRQEAVRHTLRNFKVGAVFPRPWQPLPGNLPVLSQEVLMAMFIAGYTGIVVDGPPYGVVTGPILSDASRLNPESATISGIMVPISSFPSVDAETPVFEALEMMDGDRTQLLAVVRNGVPLGLVTSAQLLECIRANRRVR
ncbi:MAG: site-2 protease family protein [Chloroflexota bacterium]|nr:site-2 protease family protein [Chloroflexota bacterium]